MVPCVVKHVPERPAALLAALTLCELAVGTDPRVVAACASPVAIPEIKPDGSALAALDAAELE